MFKDFSQFQIFKKRLKPFFILCTLYTKYPNNARILYFYLYCPMGGRKKGGSWQCQHCDLFSISVVFQCCGEEKNQMAFPSFASTLEVLYGAGYGWTYRTAGTLILEWRGEAPSGPCCARRGSACAGRPAE